MGDLERELEVELLDYTRKRFHEEKREMMRLLEIKKKEVSDFMDRVTTLEAENKELENRLNEDRTQRMDELYNHQQELLRLEEQLKEKEKVVASELQTSHKIADHLRQEIENYKRDIKEILDDEKKNLSLMQKQIEAREAEIEQARVHEQELEGKIVKSEIAYRDDKEQLHKRCQELGNALATEKEDKQKKIVELQGVLARTTSELLEQKHKAKLAQDRLDQELERLKTMQEERAKILANWEQDRKKWEALWERERHVWEQQRQDMGSWERVVEREKAKLESSRRAQEAKELRLTQVFSGFINELGRWVTTLKTGSGQPLPQSSGHDPLTLPSPSRGEGLGEGETPHLSLRGETAPKQSHKENDKWSAKKRWFGILGFLLLILGGAIASYLVFSAKAIIFNERASWDLPVTTPSGIAVNPQVPGELWIADWKSGDFIKVSREDASVVLARHNIEKTFFHPNALAFSADGKYLFTLDSVSHKIFKHKGDDPKQILEEAPTPTASSLFLTVARDWLVALDAIEKKVYFYDPRSLKAKPTGILTLPAKVTPMGISGDHRGFWILDAKKSIYYQYTITEGAHQEINWTLGSQIRYKPKRIDLAPPTGFYLDFDKSELFILTEGDPSQLSLAKPQQD